MNGRFQAYEVALELATALAPVLASLARRDSSLASQLRRAAASVPLCLAEGARRNGKDRLHVFRSARVNRASLSARRRFASPGRVAAGSAAEVRAALAVARAWSFVAPAQLAAPEALLDRVLAMLWRLTHPSVPAGQDVPQETSRTATPFSRASSIT